MVFGLFMLLLNNAVQAPNRTRTGQRLVLEFLGSPARTSIHVSGIILPVPPLIDHVDFSSIGRIGRSLKTKSPVSEAVLALFGSKMPNYLSRTHLQKFLRGLGSVSCGSKYQDTGSSACLPI
jgi:hypothetical protein